MLLVLISCKGCSCPGVSGVKQKLSSWIVGSSNPSSTACTGSTCDDNAKVRAVIATPRSLHLHLQLRSHVPAAAAATPAEEDEAAGVLPARADADIMVGAAKDG
mmetsp:Transcript_1046/g.2269  ORF Transcript_1046/g.2269 Transcript_1046/m.2269 type:complete len:104 (-) Transcript_1046:62-373(-)